MGPYASLDRPCVSARLHVSVAWGMVDRVPHYEVSFWIAMQHIHTPLRCSVYKISYRTLCIASSHHPKRVLLHPGISNVQLLKYAIPNAIAMQLNQPQPNLLPQASATPSPPALAVSISTMPCTLHAIWLASTVTRTRLIRASTKLSISSLRPSWSAYRSKTTKATSVVRRVMR